MTVNHGSWKLYKPAFGHPDAPPNTLYACNESGADWYSYLAGDYFEEDSVKMMCILRDEGYVVMAATFNEDELFPAGQMVLEVTDYSGDDPQGYFGGKIYDKDTDTFKERDA